MMHSNTRRHTVQHMASADHDPAAPNAMHLPLFLCAGAVRADADFCLKRACGQERGRGQNPWRRGCADSGLGFGVWDLGFRVRI